MSLHTICDSSKSSGYKLSVTPTVAVLFQDSCAVPSQRTHTPWQRTWCRLDPKCQSGAGLFDSRPCREKLIDRFSGLIGFRV